MEKVMRVDKYLKTARILKRREAAKGRIAKPSTEVEVGDVLRLEFGYRILEIKILDIQKQVSKQNASLLFEILKEEKIDD